MKSIAIIGAGASGSLLAVNLAKMSDNFNNRIILIEKEEKLSLGVAYSTDNEYHLLNVQASKMGAFPDKISHFYNWLIENGYDYKPSDYVPRFLYGKYLNEQLQFAITNKQRKVNIDIVKNEIIDLSLTADNKFKLTQIDNSEISADYVILALGNFPPGNAWVNQRDITNDPNFINNPWNSKKFQEIETTDTVLIVGTGLTMIDISLIFFRGNFKNRITAISRHGILPAVHKSYATYKDIYEELKLADSCLNILKIIRKHICIAEQSDSDWRAVIDSIRPYSQKIWLELNSEEKKIFLKRLSRYWDTARHRIPMKSNEQLQSMLNEHRLLIKRVSIKSIEKINQKFQVTTFDKLLKNQMEDEYDWIINCTGPDSDITKYDSKLIQNLLKKGIINSDVNNIGLQTLPNGNIINRNGEKVDGLFAIGPMLKGTLWESTAIPEIRMQAVELTNELLKNI